jgi:hypothetical protein
MCGCKFLIVCVIVAAFGAVAMDERGEELPILDTFQATVGKDTKLAIPTGFIATEANWKEVWAKVQPKEKLPAVDFARHFLLISTQDRADPNRQRVSVRKNEEGTVTVNVISTLIGFESSEETIYRFHKVSREGVTGIGRFDAVQKKLVVDLLPK